MTASSMMQKAADLQDQIDQGHDRYGRLEDAVRQSSDDGRHKLNAANVEIRQLKAERESLVAEKARLAKEVEANREAGVQIGVGSETASEKQAESVQSTAQDKKADKKELVALRSKLKLVELEKKGFEKRVEELEKRLKTTEEAARGLKEELLTKNKQLTTEKKNLKNLEKQLASGNICSYS